MPETWWERDSLRYSGNALMIGDQKVGDLSRAFDSPLFIYDMERVYENYERLAKALKNVINESEILYAIKANRFAPLITRLNLKGVRGVDVCSVGEARLALSCGFGQDQISFTSHGLTNEDVAFLRSAPQIRVNIDTLAGMRLLGSAMPGRSIGIRVNPARGYGANSALVYSGSKATKFGIYLNDFNNVLAIADHHSLKIDTIHCHAGCGFLTADLSNVSDTICQLENFFRLLPSISTVNIGGGLGVPRQQSDQPLDLDGWARLIGRALGSSGYKIVCEPGEYVVNDAGILVLKTVYDEVKAGTRFVGLDGGFNLAPEPLFYNLKCFPAVCKLGDGPVSKATVVGNINEAHDIWAEDIELPHLETGDQIALLNAGSYAASMSSNHCLRGNFHELVC